MKIALVCRCYVTQRPGGMLHVLQDRAEELARRGHTVHVLTTGKDAKQRDTVITELNGVTVHHLRCVPTTYSSRFNAECVKTVTALHPDILHLESLATGDPWWLECRDAVHGPVGVTLHGFDMGAFLTAWNMHMRNGDRCDCATTVMADQAHALAKFDRVIAISAHEQFLLRSYYSLDAVRVYNPIHPDFFTAAVCSPAADAPFLCAAVSGHRERNFDLAAKAAQLAGVQLTTVSKCARSGMPVQYIACRGVLLPTSYAQGFDLTLAEAAACGRSALVTETGSYAMERDTLGYTVIPHNIQAAALADKLTTWRPPDPAVLREKAQAVFAPSVHCDRWLLAMKGPENAADNVLLYRPQ